MKTSTKPQLKARRMWVDPELYALPGEDANVFSAEKCFAADLPVAVTPLDDVESLVVKARDAYLSAGDSSYGNMRAALVAIGVLPRAKKGRK